MNDEGSNRPDLPLLLAHQRRSWRSGAPTLVEDYLRRQPDLLDDAETVLDLIYGEILLREEAGEIPKSEDYLVRFPHLEIRLRRLFEVEAALDSKSGRDADFDASSRDVASIPGFDASQAAIVPGYEILGELGRGGMGVVYKARHSRLNRIVAIKMLLTGDHAGREATRRFLAEAEAVARIQHPNIVQIFSFQTHEGRPYLEMEYVAGGSLADRIRERPPWAAADAAKLVESLARAMIEVHRVGIVHRDLKPANILLTADGVPKIADFGLAEALDVEARLTHSLRIVGSPSYMAPEQADPSAGRVGPAADIHAMGAILYELVTGRPPFSAATVLATLEQVKTSDPVPPTTHRPDLPRDMVTICLTCLEKEPRRRYAGADRLAEDLRRFAAGEPILARPVGLAERAWRWCHREPALASLWVALVIGLIGVATQWRRAESHLREVSQHRAELIRANQREREAYDREREARERIEVQFQLGMEAVDGYSALAATDELKDLRLEGLRKRLLSTALTFYSGLQDSLEADPSPMAGDRLSTAYGRVGRLREEMGSIRDALAAYRQDLAVRETLSAADPASHARRSSLARAHVRIGIVLRVSGQRAESIQSLEQALEIEERLARDVPDNLKLKEELAWCLANLGTSLILCSRPAEAIAPHRRALEIREALARDDPANPQLLSNAAWGQLDLGMSLHYNGLTGEALRRIARAMEIQEELVRDYPSEIGFRTRLIDCLTSFCALQPRAGHPEALRAIGRALANWEFLYSDRPDSSQAQLSLAEISLSYAIEQAAAGHPDEALASIQRAEQIERRFTEFDLGLDYLLASAYAQYIEAIRREGGVSDSDLETYARLAVSALARVVQGNSGDVPKVHRDVNLDPNLDPLRSRPDFQLLMLDLSFPADPFQ